MARRFRRRGRRFFRGFRRRFRRSGSAMLAVGRRRSRILGLSIPTLVLVGGLVFIFRNKLQPLFQKITSMFKK
jgi:hypothetical protein